MAGSVDDVDVFKRAVAFLEDDVDQRIPADDRSLQRAAAELRAEAAPDAFERRPRFVAMRQELVPDPAELRDCLEISVVAGVVEEHVAFGPFEKVRVGVQYPRLVEGALPQVALELPHQCSRVTFPEHLRGRRLPDTGIPPDEPLRPALGHVRPAGGGSTTTGRSAGAGPRRR